MTAMLERIEREDLVMFINACFACTGQREFYGDAAGQMVSIGFLHEYILGNYRRLYARTLAAGINHFNQAQIITNLLAAGAPRSAPQREEEGQLIRAALRQLPPQRAMRALMSLRQRRVNNRRARAVVRDYLASRPDTEFDAVKYRSKIRSLAVHNHLRFNDERRIFLFRGWHEHKYTTALFERFRQAHYAKEAIYDLPFTVAEGFAKKHRVPRDEFLARIQGQMTQAEQLRIEASAKRSGLKRYTADLSKTSLTKLALYILGLSLEQRAAQRERLETGISGAVTRALRRSPRRLGRVAAVLDRSYSASGSSEKHRRPLAVAFAANRLLRACTKQYRAFWTSDLEEDLAVTEFGQTDLAGPLLAALKWRPELIVIISDGFENAPPFGAAEIARVFRQKLDPQHATSIIHANPVFESENYAPRSICPEIPTVGLRDAEDLLTMLGFARFAEGSEPLEALEKHLEEKAAALLQGLRASP
ncbi:MAG: hypothetical protein AAFP04_07915 [Myxococcota bacterium]